ncbi:MAG: hypothetical protein AB1306_05570 [Nitrospirota bacterium]
MNENRRFNHLPEMDGLSMPLRRAFMYLISTLLLFVFLSSSTAIYKYFDAHGKNDEYNTLRNPRGKLDYLKAHVGENDLIIWGDSRAYIGVDPAIVSQVTGLRVFNYASMAHWFPTQYPQLKRMQPYLKNKTVIWVIGHINFESTHKRPEGINDNFYLDLDDFFEYLSIGFKLKDITNNLLLSFMPDDFLLFKANSVKKRFSDFQKRSVRTQGLVSLTQDKQILETQIQNAEPSLPTDLASPMRNLDEALKEAQEYYPDMFRYDTVDGSDADNVLVSILRKNGQNPHIELNHEYLRAQQEKHAKEEMLTERRMTPNQVMEELFKRMLELFKSSQLKQLIVVEYRDTPYHYLDSGFKSSVSTYMDNIRNQVESSGFIYLAPDMSIYTDADYFDYNHLNSTASRQFSFLLSHRLVEVLH